MARTSAGKINKSSTNAEVRVTINRPPNNRMVGNSLSIVFEKVDGVHPRSEARFSAIAMTD